MLHQSYKVYFFICATYFVHVAHTYIKGICYCSVGIEVCRINIGLATDGSG